MQISVQEFKVSHVTVYTDRALITRTITVAPDASSTTASPPTDDPDKVPSQQLCLTDLPSVLVLDSVRVETLSPVTILDVATRKSVIDPDAVKKPEHDDGYKQLRAKRDALHRQRDQQQAVSKLVERYAQHITGNTTQPAVLTPSTPPATGRLDAFKGFLDYYATSHLDVHERLADLDEQIKVLDNQLAHLSKKLSDVASKAYSGNTFETTITYNSTSEDDAPAIFKLTYLVTSASWTAYYDVRAFTDSEAVEIKYMAHVRQLTGEDWSNVTMVLSTAKPSQGMTPPSLTEWNIGAHPPQPVLVQAMRTERALSRASRAPSAQSFAGGGVDAITASAMRGYSMPAPNPETVARAGLVSMTLEVQHPVTLPSSEDTHTVSVGLVTTLAQFKHMVVPKLSHDVYLKARVRNTSDYVLLPGEASIFCDHSFVGKVPISHVNPNDHFDCFLGIDASIKVVYLPAKRAHSSARMFSSSQTLTVTQTIIVHNIKPQKAILLMVEDQLPVSHQSNCKVNLVYPDPKHLKTIDPDLDNMAHPLQQAPVTDTGAPASPSGSPQPLILSGQIGARLQATRISTANDEPKARAIASAGLDGTASADLAWSSDVRGKLVWTVQLPPGQNLPLQFEYEVAYPSTMALQGL
ncbi:hypothetical protein H4R34_005103 [Dimargaris verticillata]|uniref:DUF4139 domain-containing protein n=1 Tax=Dimargaris verticillata TaxID=2761393 RepID=A0A9W8AXM7_9FUNG|nr:hypothetical protein H4R34_005103 [Dimargaris verticillata]